MRRDIIEGRLAPGVLLPTRRVLQRRCNASSTTIQAAIDELDADGFLRIHARHGTYVAPHPPHLCRFALVLPALPGPDGYTLFFWKVLHQAAGRVRRGGRRMVTVHALDQNPERPEHAKLRHALQVGAVAGLLLPTPWIADSWLHPADLPVPVAVINPPEGMHAGVSHVMLDLRRWCDAAMDEFVRRGVRSIAVLMIADLDTIGYVAHLEQGARQRGLRCQPWWVMGLDVRYPVWAWRCVRALFNPGQNEIPEGLMITDDHMVEPATRALIDIGGTPPLVIAHANLPAPSPSALPILRLGWDADMLLDRSIDAIEQHRAQGTPTPPAHLPVVLVE